MGFFATDTPEEVDGASTIQKGKDSTYPVVKITRVTPHVKEDTLQVYCYIENTWGKPVRLDKIHIFNKDRDLSAVLGAGEACDLLVYDGPVLSKEYGDVVLQFKTEETADYFAAEHTATFSYRSQNDTYDVGGIQFNEPIRDIYG